MCVCVCLCVCICVCVSEREREREKRRNGEVKDTGKEERRILWYNGKSMILDVKNSIFYS